MPFPKNPPDQPPLSEAFIARCTPEERILVGRMAELAEMNVSQFVRMATLGYISAIQQQAADRAAADMVLETEP